ncbi:hypothetical protein [Pseudomonas sp. v388]|uniref:hypothetical protein n=1 Tax=Pseudomonas sp. v388 TaxID=2479849 RepID=UPI0015AAAB8F
MYENIRHMLKTVFSSDFGFSEGMAVSIYVGSVNSSRKKEELVRELTSAFEDEGVCWRDILVNDEYEVLEFETEEEAKAYIRRVLWEPLKI